MMMWGTPSPSAKLTDDSGTAFEAPLIGNCRLFRSLARNQPPRLLGLLQQYLPSTEVPASLELVYYCFRRKCCLGTGQTLSDKISEQPEFVAARGSRAPGQDQ